MHKHFSVVIVPHLHVCTVRPDPVCDQYTAGKVKNKKSVADIIGIILGTER